MKLTTNVSIDQCRAPGSIKQMPLLLLLVFITTNVAIVHAQATFTPLGFFGGATGSEGHDVSADGSVVVGRATNFPDQSHVIFRWTRDESIVHKVLAQSELAVSDDGTTIVGSRFAGAGDEAIRWIPGEGLFEGLGDFPGGAFNSAAHDVSADGSVIVGQGNLNGAARAFRWTETSGMQDIGPLTAYGVSSDGNVIVGEGSASGAFRWTAATGMVAIPRLPGTLDSIAWGVSADGSVVVGSQFFPVGVGFGRNEASRWTEQEGTASLGNTSQQTATNVSSDGLAIVGFGIDSSQGATAFYWTPEIGSVALRDVLIFGGATGLDGWQLINATGISHDGRTVVGTGVGPDSRLQAFVATIGAVPEPSTLLLAAFATAGLIGLIFRRSIRFRILS